MWDQPLQIPVDLPAGCQISGDRSLFAEADAVVFHLPSLSPALFSDGGLLKYPGQKWVAWSAECEAHYPWVADPEFKACFDLQMSYRLDSDVPCTYVPADFQDDLAAWSGRVVDFDQREPVLANAFVSSRFDRNGRGPLLLALMERMRVDSYGSVARNRDPVDLDDGASFKLVTQARYKFSFAFENACHPDYVTEKFFQPLLAGSVPVVLGAPNVSAFAPGEQCYIDVRDFNSIDSLVSFLTAVGSDRRRYEQFHAWRRRPLSRSFLRLVSLQRQSLWSRLCSCLQAR